jgi:hypothetical protein
VFVGCAIVDERNQTLESFETYDQAEARLGELVAENPSLRGRLRIEPTTRATRFEFGERYFILDEPETFRLTGWLDLDRDDVISRIHNGFGAGETVVLDRSEMEAILATVDAHEIDLDPESGLASLRQSLRAALS